MYPIQTHRPWASCQIRKIVGCACVGNAGNVSPPPRISDPDMQHGTCVTHVPWCMTGSLTSGVLWSRWRAKRFRHSRCMRTPQFYVSGKRPMIQQLCALNIAFIPHCNRLLETNICFGTHIKKHFAFLMHIWKKHPDVLAAWMVNIIIYDVWYT